VVLWIPARHSSTNKRETLHLVPNHLLWIKIIQSKKAIPEGSGESVNHLRSANVAGAKYSAIDGKLRRMAATCATSLRTRTINAIWLGCGRQRRSFTMNQHNSIESARESEISGRINHVPARLIYMRPLGILSRPHPGGQEKKMDWSSFLRGYCLLLKLIIARFICLARG
jgi:hypothetical protein